jgi:hypothetical protein
VSIGDEESAAVGFQREGDTGCKEKVRLRRMGSVEGTDVRDDGEVLRTVDAVDAVHAGSARFRGNRGDEGVCSVADEGDIEHSTSHGSIGRQAAGEGRDYTGVRVDARNPAGRPLGDE